MYGVQYRSGHRASPGSVMSSWLHLDHLITCSDKRWNITPLQVVNIPPAYLDE